MDHAGLSELSLGVCHQTISVRVSRLWEYQGGIDHGSVKLLHMVLSDNQVRLFASYSILQCRLNRLKITCLLSQGRHVSALVPTDVLTKFVHVLYEGLICTLTHYVVTSQRPILNIIHAPLMIVFRQPTDVCPLHVQEDTFPNWICNLTPFSQLPPPNDTPTYYVGNIFLNTLLLNYLLVRFCFL
jgi:hypothetical protein